MRYPANETLVISSKARIVLTDRQTFVAELPISGHGALDMSPQSGEPFLLMILTLHTVDAPSVIVSEAQIKFTLGALQESILRMELPQDIRPGHYRVLLEIYDTFPGISLDDSMLSARELVWQWDWPDMGGGQVLPDVSKAPPIGEEYLQRSAGDDIHE